MLVDMARATYLATFKRENGGVVADFPDLRIATQGENYIVARRRARSCLEIYLHTLRSLGERLPECRTKKSDIHEYELAPRWITVDIS